MKLYLLRHGERGHGESQDTLTEKGVEQAKKVALYISELRIGKIISGDSQRAKITTAEILKIKKYPVDYTSLVNEQCLGVIQGKSGKEFGEALKKSGLSKKYFRPINGENRYDAYERARKFVGKLRSEKTENILVVSHSGFISDVITLLLDKP